jgi:hypothetical protein
MKVAGILALVLLSTLALAQNQNRKKTVPAIFDHARYVWVESMDGDIFTPTLLPADRRAIVDVQNALQKWGRYVLCGYRKDADLIFVVRTGRVAEGKTGVSVGNPGSVPPHNPNSGQQQHPVGTAPDPMGTEVMLGGAVGPPNDLLQVFRGNNRESGTQVWLRTEKDGLESPDVPLFQQLKKAIDHDYPR